MSSSALWKERPKDVFNLFNPAFCGEILRICIASYEDESGKSFPFSLIFFILPLALHKFTREQMPQKMPRTTLFLSWLQKHPEVRIDLPRRTEELVLFTHEAFLFLLTKGVITILANGNLTANDYIPPRISGNDPAIEEVKDCFRVARYIGKWLSEFSKPSLVYTALWMSP